MKPTAPFALALCLTLPLAAISQQAAAPAAPAQHATAPFSDPANLRGERVSPSNGHELPIDEGALGLAELLRRLNTRASILNIVAHPDDEDGGMLTLYSRGLGARVADLSLTRGEGGQNFVTGDFEDALGLIRTQELLANDRYTGVSQMFGTEVDFGFSKTREEAFQKWSHQRVLYDAVRAIRIVRPLVITATFIGNVTDGHGQHQVSGEIAQEAFKAAADPSVFPDMIREGILPWQALKVYARVPFASIDSKGVFDYATDQYVPARFTNYVTGKVTTTKPSADVTVPEGATDPLLTAASACDNSFLPTGASNNSVISTGAERSGETCSSLAANPSTKLSYLQFARIGLGLQRTQISRDMRLPVSGMHDSGYTLYGSVLCNAPATARDPSITPQTCHPEQAQRAEGPATQPAPYQTSSALSTAPTVRPGSQQVPRGFSQQVPRGFSQQVPRGFSLGSHGPSPELGFSPQGMPSPSTHEPAPTARPITAQGEALGNPANESSRAESPLQNSARTTQPHLQTVILSETQKQPPLYQPVILSEAARAPASSAAEEPVLSLSKEPATRPASSQPSEAFHDEPAPTARPITAQGEALGNRPEDVQRAESPIQNPALPTQPNFFTGIDTSIEGIATLAPNAPPFLPYQLARLSQEIEAATQAYDPQNPVKVAPSLKDALHTTDVLIGLMSLMNMDSLQKANVLHELRIKRVQLNDALTLALGLHLDATAPSNDLVENTSPAIKTSLSESSSTPVTLTNLSIHGAEPNQRQSLASTPQQLTDTHPLDRDGQLPADHLSQITQPYFTRDNIEQPVYQLRNPALRNAPQTPAPLTAWATVTYQGAEITLGRVVHNGPQPISIVPPVSIASAPSATVLPPSQPPAQTTAQLRATLTTDSHTSANINVQSPHNWAIQAKAVPGGTTTTHSIDFILHPTTPPTDPALFHLTATTPDRHPYTEGYRPVGYPGLILTNYYTPATTRVVPVDLKLPQHDRIAYLPGTGDGVPQALASIGLHPTLISAADLTPAKLASFDTVVLGVRAYTAHPDLQGAPTKALLDFARNGGNVVVQYQTSDFTSADAPYPLNLGYADKVVVETDPVELLAPGTKGYPEASAPNSASPGTNRYPEASASGLISTEKEGALAPRYALLNVPNRITSADFNHWIEERGHGFLESWDPHYTALTETHDPGGDGTAPQVPQRGGLITAQVGKGRWTYVAFALYRQLPEAIPGAFRLFVNLITPPTR